MSDMHMYACGVDRNNKDVWGKNNLYNCKTRTLFISYQLWTGMAWDGDKKRSCMHKADSNFLVDQDSETTIVGPKTWNNYKTGIQEQFWLRNKADGTKTQYFTCHEKGIGRVYDSRRPKYYVSGRCKFPAGYGWEIAKRRHCKTTSIQITELAFDLEGVLQHIEFKWWYGNIFDHQYRYVPNYGMTNAWEQ